MPGATAAAVAALANHFHWDEEFIRRRLPLSRVVQYLHCIAAENPFVWTVRSRRRAGRRDGGMGGLEQLDAARLAAIAAADSEVDLS